jgi:hypothetical protein
MEPAGRAAWSEDFALSTLYYADSITSVQDDQIPLIELHGLVIMLLIIRSRPTQLTPPCPASY